MSKFSKILEGHLNNTDLLRIRIKYDPANEENDLSKAKDYVGYVLQEDGEGGVVAIVPDMGSSVVDLSLGEYEPMVSPCGEQEDPILLKFKQHLVNYLIMKGFQTEVSKHMETIITSKTVEPLERILVTCSCDNSEVLNLYRDFFNNAS